MKPWQWVALWALTIAASVAAANALTPRPKYQIAIVERMVLRGDTTTGKVEVWFLEDKRGRWVELVGGLPK